MPENRQALKTFKKILRILLWVLVCLAGVVVLACVAVYLPPVQKFAVGKASQIVASKTGMRLGVEKFRLRFPIGLSAYGVTLVTPAGDTLAAVGSLGAHAAVWPLLSGRVMVTGISVERAVSVWRDTTSGMVVRARLDEFGAASASLDIGGQAVVVRGASVHGADVTLTLGGGGAQEDTVAAATTPTWSVEVRRFDLSGSRFGMHDPGATASRMPFDAGNIAAEEIELDLRDVLWKNGDISLEVRRLALAERSGLRVTDCSGRFAMTSEALSLRDLVLSTPGSHIEADAEAGIEVLKMEPDAPVSLDISASLAVRDVLLFIPETPSMRDFRDERLTLEGSLGGTLDDLSAERLEVSLPSRHLALSARGRVRSLTAVADVSVEAALAATAGKGRLDAEGSFAARENSYDAEVRLTDFPLNDFLPVDSLGRATLSLSASGRGFDPRGSMNARVRVAVDSLAYRGFTWHDVALQGTIAGGEADAHITSANEALSLDLTARGTLARDRYTAAVGGSVWRADLRRMGFSHDTLAFATHLDVRGEAAPDSLGKRGYTIRAEMDSTVVRIGSGVARLDSTRLAARASSSGSRAAIRSGDLTLDLYSPLPPDSLVHAANSVGSEVRRQLAARHFSADSLQSAFPVLTLTAKGGTGNVLGEMARLGGVDFRAFSADVSTVRDSPFTIDARVEGLIGGKLTVDTIVFGAHRNGSVLDYSLRLANRPGDDDLLGLLQLSGSAGGNQVSVNVLQRNLRDSVGMDFGLVASLRGNVVHAEITPLEPTLGYRRWKVNEGNSVEYGTDGRFRADLRLQGPSAGEYINITTPTAATSSVPSDTSVRVEAAGLEISSLLMLVPTVSVPPIDGTIALDARVDTSGRVDLTALAVALEGHTALTASGYYTAGAMEFELAIPALPLDAVEGFLPAGTAELSGELDGNVHLSGTVKAPSIRGDVGFTDARIGMEMTGTTFGISPERITLEGTRISLNGVGLVAPNNQKLTLDGGVDLSSLSRPIADVRLSTQNFRVVDSQHIGGSQVYGTAAFDADITAKGLLSGLTVRGDVALSETTDISYILRNQSRVRDEKQHIVEFTVFADSLYATDASARSFAGRAGVDMLVGVTIPDGVKATLSLDELSENRVELIGGGEVAFSMNTQGDVRLSGRYTLSGGTVYYKPPVIAQKIFAVEEGSYVEWTGEAVNPEFHVRAVQTSEITLDYDDGLSEAVAFDISIDISGSLAAIDMRFDLAAPENIAIQNQLLSMSAEQRMQQALTLLAYGQYTGPGVSSKGSSFDARKTVNEFIAKEVNQWARNNLRGVDFSMGIATRDDVGGGSHTDYSYSVSKSFGDRVKVSIGGSVSDNASSDNFADNLLDDVTLEYRLTRRENMFLKLYRLGTRPSILEGRVTETGAGFLMRKKINRIFPKKRERK